MWPDTLSGRLPIAALVGHYPTNKLIGRGPLLERQAFRSPAFIARPGDPAIVCGISPSFPGLSPTRGQVTHVLLTRLPLTVGEQAPLGSHDLHVLGTPRAFVLSQDQTLQQYLNGRSRSSTLGVRGAPTGAGSAERKALPKRAAQFSKNNLDAQVRRTPRGRACPLAGAGPTGEAG